MGATIWVAASVGSAVENTSGGGVKGALHANVMKPNIIARRKYFIDNKHITVNLAEVKRRLDTLATPGCTVMSPYCSSSTLNYGR